MAETKDDFGPKEGEDRTVGLPNAELQGALRIVQRIKAYEHANSRRGVRQEVANRLGRLRRFLQSSLEQYVEDSNELVDRFGERKNPDDPASAVVAKTSPHRYAFNDEVKKLSKVLVQVPADLRLKQSELVVRDEDGELEPIDIGGLDDMGPLLIWDGEQKAEEPAGGRERPRGKKR